MFTNLAIERGLHIVGHVPSLHSPEVKDGVPDFPQKNLHVVREFPYNRHV